MLSQYYVIDRNVGVNKMTVASAIRRERVLAFFAGYMVNNQFVAGRRGMC